MKKLFILTMYCVLCMILSGERAYKTSNQRGSFHLHVIEFPVSENLGFELVDGVKALHRMSVTDFFDEESDLFIVNGGYFDGNLNPVGYCKIGNALISAGHAPELSGYLSLDASGKLDLHWKELPKPGPQSALQSGPFLIDPGGRIGIHSDSGLSAKRTVIAKTKDDEILVITTTAVSLFELSRLLKVKFPNVDCALNLDGGPSTGLIYGNIRIENQNPVRNFLRKKRI